MCIITIQPYHLVKFMFKCAVRELGGFFFVFQNCCVSRGKVAASQSNCVGANTNNLTSKVEMRLSRGGPTRPVNLVCVHLLAEFISGDLPLALDGQIAWPVSTQASHIVCPELEK